MAVFDMKIFYDHETGALSSTWYRKPTDTGLIMNYHALAPKRYKRSIVSGFVHRIYRACSNWSNFHESLEEAKNILEANQYPPRFYGPIIKDTSDTLVTGSKVAKTGPDKEGDRVPSKLLMVQYRGKTTEEFAKALHKIKAPCRVEMTLRKLKTVLPSLKPKVETLLKSSVVYQISCPGCQASYVGQTDRHLATRFKEHSQCHPFKAHLEDCKVKLNDDCVKILHQTSKGVIYLESLEALYIRE